MKGNKYLARPETTRTLNRRCDDQKNRLPPHFVNSKEQQIVDSLKSSHKSKNNHNDSVIISSLTGLPMKSSEFSHNNMVPFFGGSLKQNMNMGANSSLLESHTGVNHHTIKKEEKRPFFKPKKNMSFVHGTPSVQKIDRYIPSRFKNDQTPIKKLQVGPGLNKGYSARPSGGFQQADTRKYAMPKSVDELRNANNPKMSYAGRVIKGKAPIDKRGITGKMIKRRPKKYYKNSPERYNTTIGAVTKPKVRVKPILKSTNRKCNREIIGGAGPTKGSKETQRATIRPSKKVSFNMDNNRNLRAEGKWNDNEQNDYGKKSITMNINNRVITCESSQNSNLTSLVKAIVSPIQDMFKTTKKEDFSQPAPLSNVTNSVKGKQNYLSDKAKTTVKETQVHNNYSSNIVGYRANTIYEGNIAKTTIRETQPDNLYNSNLKGARCVAVYDPDEIARRTIKETTSGIMMNSNLQTSHLKGDLRNPLNKAKTTIKETNIHNQHHGYLDGKNKHIVYDPKDIARTTLKETNIHHKHDGYLTSHRNASSIRNPDDKTRTTIKQTSIYSNRNGNLTNLPKHSTIYDPDDILRTTIKETHIDNTHEGQLQLGGSRHTIYDPDDTTRTTIKETQIHNQHEGNLQLSKQGHTTYNPDDVMRTTNKETSIHNTHEGTIQMSIGRQSVYDPSDTMRTTIKETHIHNRHEGSVKPQVGKPVTYDPENVPCVTGRETLPEGTHSGTIQRSRRSNIVYDPNDIMRTTIKETNIHQKHSGYLQNSNIRSTVYDPDDVLRTTIKETQIDNHREGQVGPHTRHTVYDPNDILRTTIKETQIENIHEGQVSQSIKKSTVYDRDDILPTTLKEILEDNNYEGVIEKQSIKPRTYDPDDVMRTTIKETQLRESDGGYLQSHQKQAMRDKDQVVKCTGRQTLPEMDSNKNIKSLTNKAVVYDPEDTPQTTLKEIIENNVHNGGIQNLQQNNAYLVKQMKAKTTNRELQHDEYIGNRDGEASKGGGEGYLVAQENTIAPNTLKQFTSDIEYTGTAKGDNKPVSYQDIYNATINGIKESLEDDRTPTLSGCKSSVSKNDIHIDTRKNEGDYMNSRLMVKEKMYGNQLPVKEDLPSTEVTKNTYQQLDRNNPDILKSLKENPYYIDN